MFTRYLASGGQQDEQYVKTIDRTVDRVRTEAMRLYLTFTRSDSQTLHPHDQPFLAASLGGAIASPLLDVTSNRTHRAI